MQAFGYLKRVIVTPAVCVCRPAGVMVRHRGRGMCWSVCAGPLGLWLGLGVGECAGVCVQAPWGYG